MVLTSRGEARVRWGVALALDDKERRVDGERTYHFPDPVTMASPNRPHSLVTALCGTSYDTDQSSLTSEVVRPILHEFGITDALSAHRAIQRFPGFVTEIGGTGSDFHVAVYILESSSAFFRFVEREIGPKRLSEVVGAMVDAVASQQNIHVPPFATQHMLPQVAVWSIAHHSGFATNGGVIHLAPGTRLEPRRR